MNIAPPVSVAMATYNGARFIGEQLQSLARQTVLPAELVITDDASTDETLAIAAAFAATAPFPVRIEKNPQRLDYRANFMKAAGLCRSDIVAFCDQDDVWLPHKLETCLAAFDDTDVMLAYHDATVVDAALEPIGALDRHAAPRAINQPMSIGPWHFGLGFTLLFRRDLLGLAGLWPGSGDFYDPARPEGHDQWFFFLASCLGTIRYIAQPLVLYRQHGQNTFGWKKITGGGAWQKLGQKLADLAATDPAIFAARETAAGKRASILEHVPASLGPIRLQRAGIAAAAYRRLGTNYGLRRQIYASGAITGKLGSLMTLLQSDAYGPAGEWGMGRKALARDIIRGVVFPVKSRAA